MKTWHAWAAWGDGMPSDETESRVTVLATGPGSAVIAALRVHILPGRAGVTDHVEISADVCPDGPCSHCESGLWPAVAAPPDGAVEAVLKAIRNPGSHPAHHAKVMRAHREEWPTLWAALDELLAVQP